jgi:hypothetical protein
MRFPNLFRARMVQLGWKNFRERPGKTPVGGFSRPFPSHGRGTGFISLPNASKEETRGL